MRGKNKPDCESIIDKYMLEKRGKRQPLPSPNIPTPACVPTPTPTTPLLLKYLPKSTATIVQQPLLAKTASPKHKPKPRNPSPSKSLRRVQSLPPPICCPELKLILSEQTILFDFQKMAGMEGISPSLPFQQLAMEMGAKVTDTFGKGVTVLVTDKKVESRNMRRARESGVQVVRALWVADCRQFRRRVPCDSYAVAHLGDLKAENRLEGKVSKESKKSDVQKIEIPQKIKKFIKNSVDEMVKRQPKNVVKPTGNESRTKYIIVFEKDCSQTEPVLHQRKNRKQSEDQNLSDFGNNQKKPTRKSKSRGSKGGSKSIK